MDYRSFYLPVAVEAASRREPRVEQARLAGGPMLSVTIHDVAPATQARCERLLEQVERDGPLPITWLVVPRYHHERSTPGFERWIETRLERGDELALHGFTHLDEAPVTPNWIDQARRRWYTAGEGEFAALGRREASERLDAGRRWFERRGWPLRGFVAPAWLLGAGAWEALCAQPFDYTCTLTRLVALPKLNAGLRALQGRSIVFSTRAAWRRQVSLAWNGAVVRQQQHAQWMRFELHPSDVEHDWIGAALRRWLERARCGGREAATLGALVDRFA
jgi:predicted deacetylase